MLLLPESVKRAQERFTFVQLNGLIANGSIKGFRYEPRVPPYVGYEPNLVDKLQITFNNGAVLNLVTSFDGEEDVTSLAIDDV